MAPKGKTWLVIILVHLSCYNKIPWTVSEAEKSSASMIRWGSSSWFIIAVFSLCTRTVKNLPAIQETRVWSLDQEDPPRREWQPSPVILAAESHGQRSLAGYIPWGCKRVRHNRATNTHTVLIKWKRLRISLIPFMRFHPEDWSTSQRPHLLIPSTLEG